MKHFSKKERLHRMTWLSAVTMLCISYLDIFFVISLPIDKELLDRQCLIKKVIKMVLTIIS